MLKLESVTFSHAKGLRVSRGASSESAVVAKNLRITDSVGPSAIELQDLSELTIDGGVISGGSVGITASPGTKAHLKNLLISGTSGRALEFAQTTGELEFSTIANSGNASQSAPCTVECNANFRVISSIIFQESCLGVIRDAAGSCTFQSSIVSNAPGSGFMNLDPMFVSPMTGDYHISPLSPAKDAISVGPANDFEGDPRPRGVKFDIGADEAP
jgi:hypothetical protein